MILLVNPWIYDFTAYDLWMKPLGLIYIGGILKNAGYEVKLIDCMDRNHPSIANLVKKDKYGCGPHYSIDVDKPEIYKRIPRKYKRFGIPIEAFLTELDRLNPQLILVTSGMTYWYPGAILAIKLLRERFKKVPIILGGIYARLHKEHANEFSCADLVYNGYDLPRILNLVNSYTQKNYKPKNFFPAYDLYEKLDYGVILTSYGCVFNCTYCATPFLYKYKTRKIDQVFREIEYLYYKYKVKNFAFYDDALLYDSEKHINKLLLKNVKINRFETYSNTIILDCELDFDNFLMLFDFVKKILKEVEKIAMVEVI